MIDDRTAQWDRCLASAVSYARALQERASRGEINESAIHNLMRGYLDQPAYYAEWREELMFQSMKQRFNPPGPALPSA